MVRLVMMIPLRRCGSNAIRLRLNMNPSFYSPYPLHLTDMMNRLSSYGDLSEDENYFRLIVDVVGLQSMSLIKWPDIVFDPVAVFQDLCHERERSIHKIYGHLLLEVGRKRGVDVIMDKSQDSVIYFEEYIRLFPDILFLDVIRDPRAQISSMNRAIIYDFDTRLNTERWIEARQWSDLIRQRYPDKIMTVRYEDFVLDEEETLQKICDFIRIPYLPINIDESIEARQMSALSPLWETNASTTTAIHIHKFIHFLSPDEIEAIETGTLDWMNKYNYLCITPHCHSFLATIAKSFQKNNEKEKKMWTDLRDKYVQDYILRKKRAAYIRSLGHESIN